MNLIAYALYLACTYWVTVQVGWRFYRNGRPYLLLLFRNDTGLTDSVNRLLLTGYYLLNLGYAALMLQQWPPVSEAAALLASVCTRTARIVLTLGCIHFLNMGVLYLFRKRPEIRELKS